MVLDTLGEDSTGNLQCLDGMFIATHRQVVERCPFDEATFDGFHQYDLDFTFSAYLAGFDVAAFRDIVMVHYTYGSAQGYQEAFDKYVSRFRAKHQAELQPAGPPLVRFVPATFRTRAQVRAFCRELLRYRRSPAP